MTDSALGLLLRDRRVWLLLLSSLLAIALGFLVIPDALAIKLVSKAGFWIVLLTFALFLQALWRTFRPDLAAFDRRSLDWASVGVVTAGGIILLVHEPIGFKILMDEVMLLGTSMSMHFDKTVLTPIRGSDFQGTFVILEGIMDKRPLFFPFLASLIHDLTGYRPGNLFILNGALTFVFLGLVQALGRQLGGRAAGWLAVTLCAGFPLLAQNATGGGFELLNLVMILATLLLGARYAAKRDGAALTAFCFSALLLAQVRYESVIYLLPVAGLVLWVWLQDGRAEVPWPVIAAPLLMVHYPLQHRIFDLRATAWELASKPGYEKVFSPAYIPENLQHALNFFFARPSDQPNSLVLSTLGLLAVPFFLLLVLKRVRTLRTEPPISLATLFFTLGFAIQFGLMMCYFWGKFDDVVIRRLSLPTHLALLVALLAILPQFARPVVLRALLGVAVLGLVASGVPSMASHAYSQEYVVGRETAWRRQFIAEHPRRDYLVIDNDSILWITHLVSSTPVATARGKRRPDLIFHMRNRTFSDVYVFQRYDIDPDTGRLTLREGDDLGPDFVLETVREERLRTLMLSRLSRVKEIRSGAETLTAPDPATHVVSKSRAEIERARAEYLQNFLQKLP